MSDHWRNTEEKEYLKQGSDGISGNAAVRIGDEVLEVNIAGSDAGGVRKCKGCKSARGSKSEGRLWRREEKLEY